MLPDYVFAFDPARKEYKLAASLPLQPVFVDVPDITLIYSDAQRIYSLVLPLGWTPARPDPVGTPPTPATVICLDPVDRAASITPACGFALEVQPDLGFGVPETSTIYLAGKFVTVPYGWKA